MVDRKELLTQIDKISKKGKNYEREAWREEIERILKALIEIEENDLSKINKRLSKLEAWRPSSKP